MTIRKMISYRAVWMGAAMLWIMIYHTGIVLPFPLDFIKNIGYGGVDIFLFASGIGNYYSYLKDEKPLAFMKRKILRILPVYLPIIIIWCVYHALLKGDLDLLYIPGNLLGVQAFSSSGIFFNWYFACLLICYVLTPYFAVFIRDHSFRKNAFLILVLIVASLSFINDKNFIITAVRIPMYVMGMIFAKYENYEIRRSAPLLGAGCIAGMAVLFLVAKKAPQYLWNYGMFWYPFLLMVPFQCWILSELSMFCEQHGMSWIVMSLASFGSVSLEMFMIHSFIFEELETRVNAHPRCNLIWIALCILCILLSYLYKWMEDTVMKKKRADSLPQ